MTVEELIDTLEQMPLNVMTNINSITLRRGKEVILEASDRPILESFKDAFVEHDTSPETIEFEGKTYTYFGDKK